MESAAFPFFNAFYVLRRLGYVYEKSAMSGLYQTGSPVSFRFRTFGPFNPPPSLSPSSSPALAFLSLALHSVLNARLSLLAAISTVVFLSLRLRTVSRISRDISSHDMVKASASNASLIRVDIKSCSV